MRNFIKMNILKNWMLHGFIIGLIIEKLIKTYYHDFYDRYWYICYIPVVCGLVGFLIGKKQRGS